MVGPAHWPTDPCVFGASHVGKRLAMTLRKTKTASGQYRVTFELPPAVNGEDITLCGEFNDWSRDSHRLKRRKDGRFSITMTLPPGRNYRYRFLVNGEHWENDWHADAYVPNDYGGDDSLLELPAN